MFKKFSTYIVEKIYKMGCLEGSGVPVLYIGRTVPKVNIQQLCALPTLYLCVLYLSENKQRLVPLTA
jgi:hypothetical protein